MFISDYLKETEEELIAQGKAEGKAEGKIEGKVEGAIQTYLKFYSKEDTIKNVMNNFNLSREEVLKIIYYLNNK